MSLPILKLLVSYSLEMKLVIDLFFVTEWLSQDIESVHRKKAQQGFGEGGTGTCELDG